MARRPKREREFRRGRDCPHCLKRADHPLRDDEMCSKCKTANTATLRAHLAPGVEGPESYRRTEPEP